MLDVNAIGDACPIPVIKTKEAMQNAPGEEITVRVDNQIAVANVTKLAESRGAQVVVTKEQEDVFVLKITPSESREAEEECSCLAPTGPEIVVLSSSVMGIGNEELGKVLMRGFLFALSKSEVLPKQIICYNGGAVLTCEGSESIEDLKQLESLGVEILTCGTCLDYYGLKEKLSVGSVTNMYSILEAMNGAGKIIKP